MKKLIYSLILFACVGAVNGQQDMFSFPNQLSCTQFPQNSGDSPEYFTARGSWHGYTLPAEGDTENYGKFGGPYCLKTNKWISPSLLQLSFNVAGKGSVPLASAQETEFSQFPGMLYQEFTFPDYKIEIKLNIISPRSSLYQATAINTSDKTQNISMTLSGEMFEGIGEGEKFTDGWIFKIDNKDDIFWLVRFRLDTEMELMYSTQDYQFAYKQLQTVAPGDTLRIAAVVSQYFKGDQQQDVVFASEALNAPETQIERNEALWKYIIGTIKTTDSELKKLCLKSIQTLHLNMRSFLPGFGNYNFVPGSGISSHYVNVDESWLMASSLILFDTKLAMHQFASVMSAQNSDGSINKYISIDRDQPVSSRPNEKPMAAWTAYNIFSAEQDKDFLTTIYPLIENYHNYWYENRDANKNLWCENQDGVETVEINTMLFSEKYCLKKMAEILGDTAKANVYQTQINQIKKEFNKYFFDKDKKKYCNFDLKTNTYEVANDAVGYCLWSGLASYESAEAYAIEIDNHIFDGYYDKLFASGDYDMEYFYFLIAGLKQYTLVEISDDIKTKLLKEQLKNYKTKPLTSTDPETNSKVMNSSVAASVLILLINY